MFRKALILLCWSAFALAQNQVQITQGPKVEHADSTSAIIAWSTNVSSGTAVKYGTDSSNLTQTAAMPWGGITHRVTLKNLQPNTTYFFQAVSDHAQGSGTDIVSNVAQFQTAGPNASSSTSQTAAPNGSAQTTPPSAASPVQIAAGPIPQHITDTTATIWWETAQPTTVAVKYGTTTNALNRTAQETGPATARTHKAQLTGLQPGVTYYVALVDSTGNQLSTTEFLTRTGNAAHPSEVTDGPIFEFISDRQAVIAWSTVQKTNTVVRYGTDPGNLNLTAQGPWAGGSEAHRVQLTNLHPNTKYWFEIQTAQNAGSASSTGAPTPSTTSATSTTPTTPSSPSSVASSAAASVVTKYPFQTVANASAALRFTPK